MEALGQGRLGPLLKVIDKHEQREATLRVLSPAFSVETIDHFVGIIHHLLDLEHPNIVQVYDSDWMQDGNTFIVEELIKAPDPGQIFRGSDRPAPHRRSFGYHPEPGLSPGICS